MSYEAVYGTIRKILCQIEMLIVRVPAKVDMHWDSVAIVLKFNGRRLCLVFLVKLTSAFNLISAMVECVQDMEGCVS